MEKIVNNLSRSQKSYKFVVYKAFNDLASNKGRVNKFELFKYVKFFYKSLKEYGFEHETQNTDEIILKIDKASIDLVGKYLEGMPIKRIDTLEIKNNLIVYNQKNWEIVNKFKLNDFLNKKLINYYNRKLDQDITEFINKFRVVTKKEIGKTLFSDGFIVDNINHKDFDSLIGKIEVGSNIEINVSFNKKEHNCRMRNVKQSNREKYLYRINFRKEIKSDLEKKFPYYYDYLHNGNESDPEKYYILVYSGNDKKFKLFVIDNEMFIRDKIWMINRFYKKNKKSNKFKDNNLVKIINNKLPNIIQSILDFKYGKKISMDGSAGIGRWSNVPWVGRKHDIEIGIDYLFSDLNNKIYLSIDFIIKNSITIENIKRRKNMIYENLNLLEYIKEIPKLSNSGVGSNYHKANIYAKEYSIEKLPDEKKLELDLMEMLKLNEKIQKLDRINKIKIYIKNKGFNYPEGIIENFYLSLKSKPFVLLAGISGTGKTKLVQLFSESIGYNCSIIPVKPDWNDMSDLLGYKNIEGEFQEGKLYKLIKKAISNPNKGHIVCLDEMNLARVEYYFSDILSLMETKDENFKSKNFDLDIDDPIYIPNNLYFVGTVNMDETTHPFSKKVLDRANTIEFSEVDLNNLPFGDENNSENNKMKLTNSFLETEYNTLINCEEKYHDFLRKNVIKELSLLNKILKNMNLHVGYRVRDEISFYMLHNKKIGLLNRNEAFDNQIMQKILPRIQGSSQSIKKLLLELYNFFGGNIDSDKRRIAEEILKDISVNSQIKYPKAANKVYYMIKNYEDDGFTAYWL